MSLCEIKRGHVNQINTTHINKRGRLELDVKN